MNWKLWRRLALTLVVLLTLYVGLLTAVFCLPAASIEKHAVENIKMLVVKEPGAYRFNRDIRLLCDGPASYVDALTDATMLTRNINYNENKCVEANVIQNFFGFPNSFAADIYANPFLNALNMNGYGRYWQGYEIILRPLLLVFNYVQLRYFNIALFAVLVAAVAYMFAKQIGRFFAVYFCLGLVFCKFPLIPLSLQFMNMFTLMLVALLVQQRFWHECERSGLTAEAFNKVHEGAFILGSLTVFFDFLTTPLLPWGMCLLSFIVYLKEKHGSVLPLLFYVKNAFFWLGGYLLTWLTKWVLCTLFLGNNMFLEAYKQILIRLSGDLGVFAGEVVKASAALSLLRNIYIFFAPLPWWLIITAILALLFGLLFVKYKFSRSDRDDLYEKELLALAAGPVIWYLVIKNHSQEHFWYTYRSLLISFIAICCYYRHAVDWQELLKWVKRKKD